MLENTRWVFRDKLDPLLFTSSAQQINRTCINSLFKPSSSIHLLLGELLNDSLEIIECEVYDQLQLSNHFITEGEGAGWYVHA